MRVVARVPPSGLVRLIIVKSSANGVSLVCAVSRIVSEIERDSKPASCPSSILSHYALQDAHKTLQIVFRSGIALYVTARCN